MHKKVNESVVILLWKIINKNRSQNIIKASAFYKIQNFFFVSFKANILLVHEQNVFVGVNTFNTI
jgi:hypothetical protein